MGRSPADARDPRSAEHGVKVLVELADLALHGDPQNTRHEGAEAGEDGGEERSGS
jgi:hypothetical protein